MDARLDIFTNDLAMKVVKRFVSANEAVADSKLPTATQELVKIRASQINGCGFCLDMHTKDAAQGGRPRCGSTWWPHGGRRRYSPRRSGLHWNLPSRAPASPTAVV